MGLQKTYLNNEAKLFYKKKGFVSVGTLIFCVRCENLGPWLSCWGQ